MVKFLHTADWQIGMKAAHTQDQAPVVRAARLKSAARVIELAREENVAFILVAGDTFEDAAVERSLIEQVAQILESSPVPVYLLPGNHDPLMPGGVWEHRVWKSLRNVQLMREPAPLVVDGAMLFPCPLFAKYGTANPTSWIAAKDRPEICIGLAHGTVQHAPQDCSDFPLPRNAAVLAGLDYLAIGHWHSTAIYETPAASGVMAYSGTHETTKFGERDSGNVLIVDIPSRGAPPILRRVRTGVLDWQTWDVLLQTEGDLGVFANRIAQLFQPQQMLVECRLQGLLSTSSRPQLASIIEQAQRSLLLAKFDATALHAPPEDDAWLDQVPAGVLRDTSELLRAQAIAAGASKSRDAVVAERALLELFRLLQDAER